VLACELLFLEVDLTKILQIGFYISLFPAVLFSTYLYFLSSGIFFLLLLFLWAISVLLGSFFISCFGLKNLAKLLSIYGLSLFPVLILFSVNILSIIRITYRLFVYFKIPFGYVLMPLVAAIAAGFVLFIIVTSLKAKASRGYIVGTLLILSMSVLAGAFIL